MRNLKRGFTLVELIVVITILAILGTIGYFSLSGYQVTARDSARVSDVGLITKAIELNKVEKGSYPIVSNAHDVTFSGTVVPDAVVWKEGTFGEDSYKETRRLSNVPTDPLTGNEYAYSTTTTTGEYQVGAIFEHTQQAYIPGIDTIYAANIPEVMSNHIKGNYNGKFITYVENPNETLKNIYVLGVPSILTSETGPVTLRQIYTNKSFVYKDTRNAPGSYNGRVVAKEGIQFAATTTTPVIYEGTNEELSEKEGKIEFITKLQSHYASTAVANDDSFEEINALDPTSESDTNRAVALVNTFLTTGQGGLDGERTGVSTSTVATSGGSGGSTGGVTYDSYDCDADLTQEGVDRLNNAFSGALWGGIYNKTEWCALIYLELDASMSGPLNDFPTDVKYLSNLENIHISETPLGFPEEILYLKKLEGITLSNVGLTSLPSEIGNLTNLTTLNLGYNSLTSLPSEIGNLTNLTNLNLRNNDSLTSLPPEIGNLTNLTNLNFSYSSLASLPSEIGNLINLSRIDLSGNDLTSLPSEIGNLTNLGNLSLVGNKLSSLPQGVSNLSGLRSISLANNLFSDFPMELTSLSHLVEFSISGNQLSTLPVEIRNFSQLSHLSLNENDNLGNLNAGYWERRTFNYCDNKGPQNQEICISGDGTNPIVITVDGL